MTILATLQDSHVLLDVKFLGIIPRFGANLQRQAGSYPWGLLTPHYEVNDPVCCDPIGKCLVPYCEVFPDSSTLAGRRGEQPPRWCRIPILMPRAECNGDGSREIPRARAFFSRQSWVEIRRSRIFFISGTVRHHDGGVSLLDPRCHTICAIRRFACHEGLGGVRTQARTKLDKEKLWYFASMWMNIGSSCDSEPALTKGASAKRSTGTKQNA